MKQYFKYIGYACAFMVMFSCEPIEDRMDLGSQISDKDLNITATPLIVNGKKSNKVILNNNSPVLSSWDYGIGVTQKKTDTVLMVATGENEIVFTGLNPDGSKISKSIAVEIDELTFPVPPEWAYLTGGREKTWQWDETKPAAWGNGGYLINDAPAWWAVKAADMEAQGAGEGPAAKMVLALRGAKLNKLKSNGTTETGSFSFDMSQTVKTEDGKIWSYGKFKTKGTSVLIGKSPDEGNAPIYEFDIIKITDRELVLAYAPAGSAVWATAYFWVFRAID